MPDKKTIGRAKKDRREGKARTTQAGEFVREEMEHVRRGKHGSKSPEQTIAIGLSKARRAGIEVPPPKAKAKRTAKKTGTKKAAAKKTAPKKTAPKKTAPKKRATKKAGAKRAAPKKAAPRKSAAKRAATKKAGRKSSARSS